MLDVCFLSVLNQVFKIFCDVLEAGFLHLTFSHLKMKFSTGLILFTLEHQVFCLFSALLVLPPLSDDISDTKK